MIHPTGPTTNHHAHWSPLANSPRAKWRGDTLHTLHTLRGGPGGDRIRGDACCDRLDGLTVDCGDWWFNLRPSNTEPLLRLNLEARSDAECTRRLAEVREAIGELTS